MERAIWFLGVPLRRALTLFNLPPVPRSGFAVIALVALGTLLRHRDVGLGVVALAAQAGLVGLALLPNLVVAESWPAFRSSLPMAMTVVSRRTSAVTEAVVQSLFWFTCTSMRLAMVLWRGPPSSAGGV